MTQEQAILPKEPRYPEAHPLNWPPPPKGLRAFLVMLLPADKAERTVTGRLQRLSNRQLAWVIDTIAIEIARRQEPRRREQTDGKGETP